MLMKLTTGVVGTHGQYWKELRRFMLRNLRDFGFGKSSMGDLFQEEAEKLCNALSKTAGNQTLFQTHCLFLCVYPKAVVPNRGAAAH